jgi:hypothetical protein
MSPDELAREYARMIGQRHANTLCHYLIFVPCLSEYRPLLQIPSQRDNFIRLFYCLKQ